MKLQELCLLKSVPTCHSELVSESQNLASLKQVLINISKIILIILSVLFLFNFRAFAQNNTPYKTFKPFKMVFITDTHLALNAEDDWILHKESLIILQDTIKYLKKKKNINFVVFGGDLVENNDHKYEDLPMLLDVLSELKPVYYTVMGDREADLAPDVFKSDFLYEFQGLTQQQNQEAYWITEPVPNVVLIGLDTTMPNSFKGKISESQLAWLDKILAENKDKFTIITMHHPAIPDILTSDKFIWKDYELTNADEFNKIIQKYPQVKVILSGHHHLSYVKNVNNKLYVSTPSIVTYPNQYSVLSVDSNKISIQNEDVSYKQMIKKAKKDILESNYYKQYNILPPAEFYKLQKGVEKLQIRLN